MTAFSIPEFHEASPLLMTYAHSCTSYVVVLMITLWGKPVGKRRSTLTKVLGTKLSHAVFDTKLLLTNNYSEIFFSYVITNLTRNASKITKTILREFFS